VDLLRRKLYVYAYIHIHLHIYVQIHMYMCLCVCVCTYLYLYIYIYMYIRVSRTCRVAHILKSTLSIYFLLYSTYTRALTSQNVCHLYI
jgi:hypothetical protein